MGRLASRAGQHVGFSKTEEAAAHRLAASFSKLLGTYIDPYSLKIYPARGYWTHMHQDVQRFTGTFPRPDFPRLTYDFGCWDLTVSQIAKGCRMSVDNSRHAGRSVDAAFMIFKPAARSTERDTSNDWYSGPQLEEMARREAVEPCSFCDDWGGVDGRPFCAACENRAYKASQEHEP